MDQMHHLPLLPAGAYEMSPVYDGMDQLFADELGPHEPRQVEVSLVFPGGGCPMSIATGFANAEMAFAIVWSRAQELGEFEISVKPA